jgi:hypothetical protein
MRLRAVNVTKSELLARAIKVVPEGTLAAKAFITEQHGNLHLPCEDIFAFVAKKKKEPETYVIVSEVDKRIEIVGCTCHKNLMVTDNHFDDLVTLAKQEAAECGIDDLPYSLTFANEHGVFSFVPDAKRSRGVA